MATRSWITVSVLSVLLTFSGCASPELLKNMENELYNLKMETFRLRSQVEEFSKKMDEEHLASTDSRNQNRRFRADLQETLSQIQSATRILSNQLGDTKSKVSAKPLTSPMNTTTDNLVVAPCDDDGKIFSAAVLDYNRGNYALASEGLSLFLKNNPKSDQCSDALFYLGLCYYNQKFFDKAKLTFEQIIHEHSASPQFIPAKLKRGQCLCKMDMKPAAIKAFKEIVDVFAGSPEAHTAKQELIDLGF